MRVIFKTNLAPGDLLTVDAMLASLHEQYPGQFTTDVHTWCREMFLNSPYITPLTEADQVIELDNGWSYNNSHKPGIHMLAGFVYDVAKKLSLPDFKLTTNKPHIYFSNEELASVPFDLEPGYWLINAGTKQDYGLKQWPVEYFQEVVERMPQIRFVQVGHQSHFHSPLNGVRNLVGKTTIRDMLRLSYFSAGALTGVSFLTHLSAANNRPCVTIYGGREMPAFTHYPRQTSLHVIGALDCCSENGCWRSNPFDAKAPCAYPVKMQLIVGRCMTMIQPVEAVTAIRRYDVPVNKPKPPPKKLSPEQLQQARDMVKRLKANGNRIMPPPEEVKMSVGEARAQAKRSGCCGHGNNAG